jgi:hypothetical protein
MLSRPRRSLIVVTNDSGFYILEISPAQVTGSLKRQTVYSVGNRHAVVGCDGHGC